MPLDAEGLAALPVEWRQFYRAAVLGDDDAVLNLLETLPKQHKAISDIIRHYASAYNFAPIIDAAGTNLQT